MQLLEYIDDCIWLKEYPVHYFGCDFNARMSIVRLADSTLMLHSPCNIDEQTKNKISALGEVAYIVAPGSYHYFHVESAQAAFPQAQTYICPGIERKCPNLAFDWFLSDRPIESWQGAIEQVLVRGTRYMWEVALFHKPSRTLLLVDLIENFTDQTPDVSWQLKLWWKVIFRMWNRPGPAPEYNFGWADKKAAKESLLKILEWDFQRIVPAHGDIIEGRAKEVARQAWKVPLGQA